MRASIALLILAALLSACASTPENEERMRLFALGLSAAAAGYSAGYNSYQPYRATPVAYDYQWEWDEFYDQTFSLVWACRGVQTGQFAQTEKCEYKAQVDWKWPSKQLNR